MARNCGRFNEQKVMQMKPTIAKWRNKDERHPHTIEQKNM